MSGGKRFRWMRKFRKPKGTKVQITFSGKPIPIGGWKRPCCNKCGKKIRDIRKLVYVDGKPYHKRCLDDDMSEVQRERSS
mgnify:FL=1